MTTAPPLIVVAGATATGKTDLGVQLAERIIAGGRPAAVISADSRQVYRGLDIGTAKVDAVTRARVPHHGLDLVDPDAAFSIADFASHVAGVLAELGARDSVALLVGGTGLYLRTIGRGLDTTALPSDPALRARLEADLEADGLSALVDRLEALAPSRVDTIDLRNPRRVVRALEIAELSGDAPLPEPRGYPGRSIWLGLTLAPAEHQRRIAVRARRQFDAGLIEEARDLRARFDPTLPAFSAIGYREAWAVLDGELARPAAIELDARRNVQFAKRQATWFRREPDVHWLDASDPRLEATAWTLAGTLLER